MNQVKSLTDHEVFVKLKEMGYDIGPVMSEHGNTLMLF